MNLLTAGQARAFEALVRERLSLSEHDLIAQAGAASAAWLEPRFGPVAGRRVAVFCGKGNNAADGLVLARVWAGQGAKLSVVLAFAESSMAPEARFALERLRESEGLDFFGADQAADALQGADLAVDALVGTGSRLPLEGSLAVLVGLLENFTGRVFALDLPSGLDADTGATLGPCVRAHWTLSFLAPKLGLVLGQGPGRVGDLGLATLGAEAAWAPDGPGLYGADAARQVWLPRPWDFHKRKAELLVLAGSRAYLGAALLCARSAYRAGAGLVRLALPEALAPFAQAALPEAVVMGFPVAEALGVEQHEALLTLAGRAHAVVVGPGLGRAAATLELVARLWQDLEAPALFDADALSGLRAGSCPKAPRLLTPHEGELKALLGAKALDQGRLAAVQALARGFSATALLKGPATLVADPDGRVSANPGSSSALATAGSGDVLAGLIGALLAQGYAPFEAAALGAWVHAGAALAWCQDRAGADRGLLASDLAEGIPAVLAGLGRTA